jgi:hypothetical protein
LISARLVELKMLHRLLVVLCLVLQSSGSARAWDSEELGTYHRQNMGLDLQSLFGLHVHSCTHCLRPRTPLPPSPRI